MKRIIYVSLFGVFCFIASCRTFWSEEESLNADGNKNRLTLEIVQDRFGKEQSRLAVFTRNGTDQNTIMPDNLVVHWDKSIWSAEGGTESVESLIEGNKKFIAYWDANKMVEVRQRLLAVIDPQDSLPFLCVETLIPTPEFYAAQMDDYDRHFVNCDWRTRDFSGVILVHTLDGLLCRIVRVDDGLFFASYNAYANWLRDDYVQLTENEINFMMSDVKIYLQTTSGITRAVDPEPDPKPIDVEPVIITGSARCLICKKMLRECKCGAPIIGKGDGDGSHNDKFETEILVGGGVGGSLGDLNNKDKENKDTEELIEDLFNLDASVDKKQLVAIIDNLKDNCLGNYLLSQMTGSNIPLVVSSTLEVNGRWDGTKITISSGMFTHPYGGFVLAHEMFHAFDKDRTRPKADREMQAYYLTNALAGKTIGSPTSQENFKEFDRFMREFTNNYSFVNLEMQHYNEFYKECYPLIEDKLKGPNGAFAESTNSTLVDLMSESGCFDKLTLN